MIDKKMVGFKALLAGVCFTVAAMQGATAAEVAGIKFSDQVKVAGKDLQLNGLGVRTKFIIKVYAAGLYLQDKRATVDDIMKAEGPRRMQLVMMRDIASDDFGNAFMTGLNNNLDSKEKSKIVNQIGKFGDMFATLESLKKGDTLDIDWIPGTGTVVLVNGKRNGEPTPDLLFYNSILKIWLGDKPADESLKGKLLAASAKK